LVTRKLQRNGNISPFTLAEKKRKGRGNEKEKRGGKNIREAGRGTIKITKKSGSDAARRDGVKITPPIGFNFFSDGGEEGRKGKAIE